MPNVQLVSGPYLFLQVFSGSSAVSLLHLNWIFKNESVSRHFLKASLKGCGMGPWLVLVSPCFRENVVATCKIGSFLCSLDNLLQKNVIVFFFGN